jgi:RNA polymerase subunit RPABC4/transcription elongation factor Spt4
MDAAFGLGGWLLQFDWPGGSWQTTVRFVVAALVTYYAALWAGMVWWTFRDIRERTRDPFMQVLAVLLVLIFSFAGLVIYLITRPRLTLADAYARTLEEEALLQELEDLKACPTCRRRVADDYIVCPTCETQLKEPCSRCSRPLSYSWAACPYCATPRRAAARRPLTANAPDAVRRSNATTPTPVSTPERAGSA